MPEEKIDFKGENAPVPENFSIPSVGIESIDRALFDHFDKKLSFEFKVDDKFRKVPVVFSTGERFALTRRTQPIRDRNNAIILPIIAIKRGSIDHDPGQGGYGTAISFRDQPSYVIKKRLSETDRKYQKFINKLGLKNQSSVATRGNFQLDDVSPGNVAKAGKIATRRNNKSLSYVGTVGNDVLDSKLGNNIFEIITIPYPNFITLNYEVVYWTQYTTEMNAMIESTMAQFDGQDQGFQIEADGGFKFVAYVKSPFNAQDNFSDFSSDERIIKYSFNIVVPGYILAPQHAGLEIPFRSYTSAPTIDFGYKQSFASIVGESNSENSGNNVNKFILSDFENIGDSLRRGQSSERIVEIVQNPFTGKDDTKFSKVVLRNERSGETVASSRIIISLDRQSD